MDCMAENRLIEKFRDGIFALRTRRFGTVAEIMVKKIYDLEESGTLAFDKRKRGSRERIEVKFSTVMKKNECTINDNNVIEQCLSANLADRALKSEDAERYKFDSNIQQVKGVEFDVLYYGLFFEDKIEIFKMTRDQVLNYSEYSDKQHRGNEGEGQFHLKNTNIKYHRDNFLEQVLTYAELYELLK